MQNNKEDTSEDKIREDVEARIREEDLSKKDNIPELTHDKVSELLYANELGDGLVFAHLFAKKHVYVGQAGEWMSYSGHHWHMDKIDNAHAARGDVEGVAEVYKKTAAHYHLMSTESEKSGDKGAAGRLKNKREELNRHVTRLRSKRGRANCLEFAKTNRDLALAICGDEIDRNPWAFPVTHGVINLKTGEICDGRPEDYLLKANPVEWKNINEPCPIWEKFTL